MKAKDLMIGDLIKTNSTSWSEDLKDKYCKVTFLAKNYVSSISVDDSQKEPYGEDSSFDPIPITPEILEKNGFKEDDEGVYGDSDSYFIPTYQNGFDIGMWETHVEPTEGIGDFNGNLKHVHQLQHALRLCGIEKEIIL